MRSMILLCSVWQRLNDMKEGDFADDRKDIK